MSFIPVLLLLVLACGTPAAAQAPTVFRARLVHVDGLPTANLRVRFPPHGSTLTDASGQFSTALPADVAEVTIELVDDGWTVLYPRGGHVAVPRDPSRLAELIVGESVEAATLRVFAEQHEKLAAGLAAVGAGQDEIRGFLQEFAREITARLDVDVAALQRQIELQRERMAQFPKLAATMKEYILAAKDLKDFFRLYGAAAFSDREVYLGLHGAAEAYGDAYRKLDNERPGFEYQVRVAWQSEELQSDLRAFYDFAMTEIHSLRFLQLNESLKVMHQALWAGGAGRPQIREAQHTIDRTVGELELRLPELERRADRLLAFLSRS